MRISPVDPNSLRRHDPFVRAVVEGLAALAETQTRLCIGRVAEQGAESDSTGATDLAVALQAAWHDALTDALLTFSEKTSSAIAAAATLACGANDAFASDVALVHALVPVVEVLTRPVADSAATRERRRWKKIEAQLVEKSEARRREKAATVDSTPKLPDADPSVARAQSDVAMPAMPAMAAATKPRRVSVGIPSLPVIVVSGRRRCGPRPRRRGRQRPRPRCRSAPAPRGCAGRGWARACGSRPAGRGAAARRRAWG